MSFYEQVFTVGKIPVLIRVLNMSTSADVILTPKNVCGLGVHEYSIKPFKNVFVHNPFMEWPAYQVHVDTISVVKLILIRRIISGLKVQKSDIFNTCSN